MEQPSTIERIISPLSLACTAIAAGLWYLWPQLGWWPLLIALTPWLLRLVVQRRLFYTTPFDWALLLFLFTAGLSVWAASDRQIALAKFWPIVAGVLLFYAVSNWQHDDDQAAGKLGWLLALFGAAVSLYYLAVNDWVALPARYAVLTRLGMALQLPFQSLAQAAFWHRLHPNVVGGMLAMTAPFAGMVIWRTRQKKQRWSQAAAILLLGVILFGLVMTSSRGAWLGLVAAVLLALWWELADRLAGGSQTRRRRLFVGSLAVGLTVLLTALILRPSLVTQGLASLSPISGVGRLQLFQGALTLIQDYPLIGAGLDLFQMLHASYAMLLHVGFAVHSHNLYLNVAIEQGLPGLYALLWLWAIFAMVLWQAAKLEKRKLRNTELPPEDGPVAGASPASDAPAVDAPTAGESTGDAPESTALPQRRSSKAKQVKLWPAEERRQERQRRRSRRQAGILAAASISLLTIALHGMVDDAFYGSRAVMLLFIPLAFTATRLAQWRQARNEGKVFERAKLFSLRSANLTGGIALALLLFISTLMPATWSYWWSNLAAVEQSRMELAIYNWPEWPLQDQVRRQVNMTPIVEAYKRALVLNPRNFGANRRLGMIELSLGDYENALYHLEQAHAGEGWDNSARQLLGEALIANGRVAEGVVLWRSVDNTQGQLDLRRFWYEHIGDADRLAWMEEALNILGRRR